MQYSQKCLDYAKKSATNGLKTALKIAIQKTVEATSDLIGNKITKISRTSLQNSSESVTNETRNIGLDREIPKNKCLQKKDRNLFII